MQKNNNSKIVYPKLSYKIMGIVFGAYNDLGYGYQEKYYQRAIALDFDKNNIKYIREKEVKLNYNGKSIGRYFLDFLVKDKIVLELKVSEHFHTRDIKQILGYLKSDGLKLGILILFTKERIKYKRIINF